MALRQTDRREPFVRHFDILVQVINDLRFSVGTAVALMPGNLRRLVHESESGAEAEFFMRRM